jgi:hypothetical protein
MDLARSRKREKALVAVGFRVVSATTFQCAKAMAEHCNFSIVLLDHECCAELASVQLPPPYLIVGTEPGIDESILAQNLVKWRHPEVPIPQADVA